MLLNFMWKKKYIRQFKEKIIYSKLLMNDKIGPCIVYRMYEFSFRPIYWKFILVDKVTCFMGPFKVSQSLKCLKIFSLF